MPLDRVPRLPSRALGDRVDGPARRSCPQGPESLAPATITSQERSHPGSRATWALGILLALVLAGCGGGGSGTATSPDAPVIGNARTSVGQQTCSTGAGTGTTMDLTFDYSDSDANIRGGRVEATGTFSTFMPNPITVTFSVPGDTLSTTGTTSGSITLGVCVTFGGTSQITVRLVLFDAANNRSNPLDVTVPRPGGAP